MFSGHRIAAAFATLAIVALMMPAWAADDSAQEQPESQTAQQPAAQQPAMMNRNIDRARQLIGLSVQDAAGKAIGEIEDLVVEGRTGRLAYIALRYDQTLGFGGKLAAIPPPALTITRQEDQMQARLAMNAADLKAAPSIDEENWPDAGDRAWRDQLNKFYNVSEHAKAPAARPETLRDKPDAAVAAADDHAMTGQSYRVGLLFGLKVQSQAEIQARAGVPDVSDQAAPGTLENADENKQIGQIRDVLINRQAHRAMFVLVDYGGRLGVGEKTAVAPFASFKFTRVDKRVTLATLNADQDTLKQNTISSEQDVTALAQADRARRVFESYNQTPYWETFGYQGDEAQPDSTPSADQKSRSEPLPSDPGDKAPKPYR